MSYTVVVKHGLLENPPVRDGFFPSWKPPEIVRRAGLGFPAGRAMRPGPRAVPLKSPQLM